MIPACRRGSVLLLTLLLVIVLAPVASAHTELASSTPADGAEVSEPLDEVRLTFAEALAPDGDHAIGVYAPDGDTRVDLDDLAAPSPEVLTIGVDDLAEAGTHEVRWLIIAADGDEQRGEFTFEVTEAAVGGGATEPTAGTKAPGATATDEGTSTPAEIVDEPTTDEPMTAQEVDPDAASQPDDEANADTVTDETVTSDDGGGNIATTILLVLVALGLLAAIVFLVMRSRGSTR